MSNYGLKKDDKLFVTAREFAKRGDGKKSTKETIKVKVIREYEYFLHVQARNFSFAVNKIDLLDQTVTMVRA